jgi:hypothetical protein
MNQFRPVKLACEERLVALRARSERSSAEIEVAAQAVKGTGALPTSASAAATSMSVHDGSWTERAGRDDLRSSFNYRTSIVVVPVVAIPATPVLGESGRTPAAPVDDNRGRGRIVLVVDGCWVVLLNHHRARWGRRSDEDRCRLHHDRRRIDVAEDPGARDHLIEDREGTEPERRVGRCARKCDTRTQESNG